MLSFLEKKSINGVNYFNEKNPFMLLSYDDWVDRNKLIKKYIFQKLEYSCCQRNFHGKKCSNNIEDSCLSFIDLDFTSLSKGTVSHENFIRFMYVNYLYNCCIYYNKTESYTVRDILKSANINNSFLINEYIFYSNYYLSIYPLNLLLDNISKYSVVKEFNMGLNEIESYCKRVDFSVRILMEPVSCFSCFKEIHEGLMELIEKKIINIIEKDYKVIRVTRLKEYVAKKKELNKKKPKRIKRKGYISLKRKKTRSKI